MSLSLQTMFPGDIYESALRLGNDTVNATTEAHDAVAQMQNAWRTAVDLGWPSLLVPEGAGGAEASFKDLAGIVEAAGYSGCSLPVASLCHRVTSLLSASQNPDALALLSKVAGGEAQVAFALVNDASFTIKPSNDGYLLNGHLHAVEIGCEPDVVLVAHEAQGGDAVVLAVPVNDASLSIVRTYSRMDGRVVVDLSAQAVQLNTSHLILEGNPASQTLRSGEAFGVLFTAIECAASMGRLLEETIEYVKTRQQFGTTLSTFQVLRHAIVDIYVEYENFKAQIQALVDQTSDTEIDARRSSLLMLSLAQTGRQVGESAIQLHGGMGMTEELLAARLAKRLIYAGFEHGGEGRHLTLAGNSTFELEHTQ